MPKRGKSGTQKVSDYDPKKGGKKGPKRVRFRGVNMINVRSDVRSGDLRSGPESDPRPAKRGSTPRTPPNRSDLGAKKGVQKPDRVLNRSGSGPSKGRFTPKQVVLTISGSNPRSQISDPPDLEISRSRSRDLEIPRSQDPKISRSQDPRF